MIKVQRRQADFWQERDRERGPVLSRFGSIERLFSEGKGQLLVKVTFSMRSEPWCKICSASNTPAAKD